MTDAFVFSKECVFCDRALERDVETVHLSVREPDDQYLMFECHLKCLVAALRDGDRQVFEARIRNLRRQK